MATPRFADAVTLDQLEIFVAVVDAGSFTGAAKKLRRAQSAVSYGIAQLEQQLDLKLLERGQRGAGPTPRGRILLAEAREVVAQADRLRATALAFSEQVEPEVSLSVSPIYPLDRLAEIAREMRDRFPHTGLRVHAGNLGATLADVASGRTTLGFTGLDVAACLREALPAGSRVTLCAIDGSTTSDLGKQLEMSRVVGPSHALAARRGPVSAKALRDHLQLVAMDTSEMADKVSLNVLSPRVWRVADTMIRYQMTLAGVGWTHFVRPWIAADIEAGKLVELRYGKHEVAPRYTPRVFYRTAAPPGPAGRWLVERLCDDVRAPPGSTRPRRR
jgi:DNA-binding transcriptional LysR family regulator